MIEKKPLLILTGPTAVGKTKASIALAKALNGEIISADSMQVYRYMDIGTAKIKSNEMEGIPHHLVDVLDPSDEFSVAHFKKMALESIEEIYKKGKLPIIVGGTGFYIQALLYDVNFTPKQESAFREQLEQELIEKGAEYLHDKLKSIDNASAEKIHRNNTKRVIRAIEYFYETGKKISEHNEEAREKDSPYDFVYFVLNDERSNIYQRIDLRVDQMIEEGLVEEVKSLLHKGYQKDLVSLQGLGYKEIIAYLNEEMTLEEAIYILKRDTRHFAKRQLTWFRRERTVTWVDRVNYKDEKSLIEAMVHIARERIV